MTSLKARLIIGLIRNRHLLRFSLQKEHVDRSTSTPALRAQHEKSAAMFKLPAGIQIRPAVIDGLPDGLKAEWICPANPAPGAEEKVIFYTHGGGYVTGSVADHRAHVAKIVAAARVRALLYDYRLAPEHPFPAGMDDTLTAYRWLLAQGIPGDNIIIVGESAGGGLCLATLVAIRDLGLPRPAAGAALSPWTDLKCTGESYQTKAKADISTDGSWTVWNHYYAGEHALDEPWVSPLYADLHGLPPLFIQVGSNEILLDDATRFADKARQAGVEVNIKVWPGMVHCFALLAPFFPEATEAFGELVGFIREKAG